MRVRSSPFPALTSINSNSELSHLQTSTLTSVNPNSELSHLNSELSHEWSSDVRVQSSSGVPHSSASSQFNYNALKRPTAALNDRTSITNDFRHLHACQIARKSTNCILGPPSLGTTHQGAERPFIAAVRHNARPTLPPHPHPTPSPVAPHRLPSPKG